MISPYNSFSAGKTAVRKYLQLTRLGESCWGQAMSSGRQCPFSQMQQARISSQMCCSCCGDRVQMQYRHLIDEQKCELTRHRFGPITGKYVLYRGEDMVFENGITYRNVEDYLIDL